MTVEMKNIGFLKNFTQNHPEEADSFIDLKAGDRFYPSGEKEQQTFSVKDMDAALKPLKEDQAPALGYNNGVYCLTSYEFEAGSKDAYRPHVYLFTDKSIADEMKKQGVRDVGANFYVPMSNGEHPLTVPNLNILREKAAQKENPKVSVKESDIGFLKKLQQDNPRTANSFIELKAGTKYYPLGEKEQQTFSVKDMEAALKPLKENPAPALGYNNGVYCLTSYEFEAGSKDAYRPCVHLFTDERIAAEIKAQGVRDVGSNFYVPMSNGEHPMTVPNLNILRKMANSFPSPIEPKKDVSAQIVKNALQAKGR